ncbi:hypothetical protein P9222_08625 [Paenibacillus amylolyticus]|nr:hypothetical protein [Paenibacillus amylolyticus]WFR65500.1 hypothetical protein P9222_08625 [Paenibacillus amylolyticus]
MKSQGRGCVTGNQRVFWDNKYPPTTRELSDMMGWSSSSTAHGYLDRLEKKGYIKRSESIPRGIKIMKEDDIYGE